MLKNKKDVIQLEKNLQHIEADLDKFTEEMFNQNIINKWDVLKEQKYLEDLQSVPIDTISTLEKGIPIYLLINEDIDTIYDAKDKSIYNLEQINGIGRINAEAIVESITKIKTSLYNQAVPRINPDNLSGETLELLESIYKKWKLSSLTHPLQDKIDNFNERYGHYIKNAKKEKNYFMSLFQSQTTKEKITIAFDELNKSESLEVVTEINDQYEQITNFSVTETELKEHFVKENAAYFTEIEKVTDYQQADMTKDLPTEIVEEVNKYPLNTANLNIDLRKYQAFGAKYGLHFKRTLLGDEMGLGKTIQALAIINHLYAHNKKYSIVVCPLSILANWKREIQQHSKLKTFIFHGNDRDLEFNKWQEQKGVLLTTYEHTLRMDFADISQLDVLIVDEAHYVKNPEAKRSKSVYQLADMSEYVMFMSGTPLENRLQEMKQLISVLQADISKRISSELHLLEPTKFKQTIAEVYLRRNRKDVLGELPELEIIPQWVDFSEKEERIYNQAVNSGQIMLMRRAAWLGGSPSQSPKLEKLLTICEEAKDNGHKVLIFSFFRDTINIIREHLHERTFEPITGDVPNTRRQEIIDQFTEAKPGSVLISQINAGGVGLNIQAANVVILCEPQWKPSTEEQAIGRAYRMGQSRDVLVYRLLTENSIDESMLEILGEKAKLFDIYARESEIASQALKVEDEAKVEKSIQQKILQIEQERLKEKEKEKTVS